jgi:hypothetical protein
MLKIALFYGMIVALFCFSCNKDESSDTLDPITLGDFEINISNITLRTALINWTAPDNGENLSYDVYLNQVLVEENIEELEFSLMNLEKDTTYEVKVIAKNSESSVEQSQNFTTLASASLLLSDIRFYENDNYQMFFTYDTEHRLLKKETLGCSADFNNLFTLQENTYNNEGKISKRIGKSPYGGFQYTIDYFYTDGLLILIEMEGSRSTGSYTSTYTFSSQTQYVHEIDYFNLDGNYTFSERFEGTITRNNEHKITRVSRVETTTGYYDTAGFDYNEGNLIGVVYADVYTAGSFQIEYDDKPSFHTYTTGAEFRGSTGNACLQYNIVGLFWVESLRRFDGFYDMLPFYTNVNVNNPVRYTGDSNRNFNYEYNEYDYPSKVSFDSNIPEYQYVFNFNYEVLE